HYLYEDYQESYRDNEKLDWVIVGGESGPNARVCQVKWIQSIVNQCEQTGTPIFVKQLGSNSNLEVKGKGDNPQLWPQSLQFQEFPSIL
ncbi:phage Gp37/Gp68 family protein, partial [Ancylothrix sp. C2]|uniref:phage Gp37/Gp68 family protein n=1 Tax=Ancylothrix sp. D3o TaxID=2953691 RepID=UPI0021BAC1D4